MKKSNKKISILLALLMILSSFGAVFAEGEAVPDASGDSTAVTETSSTEPAANESDAVTDGQEDEAAPADETQSTDETQPEESESIEPQEVSTEPDAEAAAAKSASAEPITEVSVTVDYVYEDGTQAADSVSGEFSVGEIIESPAIVCYEPDKAQIEVTGDAAVMNETVTYSPVAPAKPLGFKLHPSYNTIILTWNKVNGAEKYIIQRSTDKKTYKTLKTVDATSAATMTYKDTKATGTDSTFNRALTYYYRVYAVSDQELKSAASAVLGGTCVRPMYETVTFKASAKLTSHAGKKRTTTFKKGQTIVAQGFGGGKYRFWYKGSYYYANYVRVYKCKANYQANTNGIVGKATSYKGIWAKQDYAQNSLTNYKGILYYDKTTAEDFVNRSGRSSKTKYLIWVSTYTQHLYVFKGSKGKWKLVKDWECSTGAAGSPTPTGFNKQIVNKWRNHSSINYWSPFQNANSIHGQKSKYRFGKPQSNGCVRNYDNNAKWVYYNCAKGTGLIIY